MHRVVSTLLIPLLLVSQSLISVPHSHAGTSVVEPQDHDARPHLHLGHSAHHHGEHHHGGDDGDQSSESPTDQLPDHESDAVYAGDIQLLNDGKVAKVAKAELATVCLTHDESMKVVLGRRCTQFASPRLLRQKCALYLQLLSIRC